MTRQELLQVKGILLKIKNQDPFVHEALHSIDRDIVRREQQSKAMRDNNREGYDIEF